MADLTTVRVFGTWQDAELNPLRGWVSLSPAVPVNAPSADLLIATTSVRAYLDSDGYFEANIIRSNDPALSGPMPYRLVVDIPGHYRRAVIEITADTDLADVAPLTQLPPVNPVYLLAAALGDSVAPLVAGKVPSQYLPPGGGGGGVTDHGDLTGLGDNDHPQYSLTGHDHDGRYYTDSETDTLLTGKAGLSHTHGAGDVTTGTLAIGRVPVGSTAGTVAAGNDARLTDARTPLAHAASHASGGTDEIAPADIGAARFGLVYPLHGYGDWHSASCVGESAQVQSSFSSWHLRIWVPPGKPITKIGMAVSVAGVLGVGGLNAVAFYEDDGQTFLGDTGNATSLWTSAGPRSIDLPVPIPGDPDREFIRVIPNLDGWNSSPSVVYAVPGGDQGYSVNGPGTLVRSAFKGPYVGSFPATITPASLGTPTNFIPFVVLG